MAAPSASLGLASGLNVNYTTGSLFSQIHGNPDLNWTNANPLHNLDPGVNLTVYPNNTLQLNFLEGQEGATLLALPLIATLLNPNASRVLIECVYPLSGQYDTLPRVLFYLSLLFGFVFRHRNWVGDAILGSAMLYSAIAAIHFFVLQATYDWGIADAENSWGLPGWDSNTARSGGDIDFWGIFPVLTVTGVMLAPILSWSSTFRKHEARPVIVIWATLIFAALVPALIRFWEYYRGEWLEDMLPSFAYCTETNATTPGCSSAELDSLELMTLEWYNKCNCVDFCGLLQPTAPMRTNTNMVARLARQAAVGIVYKKDSLGYYEYNGSIDTLSLVVLAVWGFALIQGILAILQGRYTQSRVRNQIFRFLNADVRTFRSLFYKDAAKQRFLEEHPAPRRDSIYRKCRRGLAKTVATAYYATTALGWVIYPAALVITIVLNETLLGIIPASEHSSSLGAWSPWAAAGLVIFASIGMVWLPKLGAMIRRTLRHFQKSDDSGPGEKGNSSKERKDPLAATFSDIPRHLNYKKSITIWGLRTEWQEFRDWWKDPEGMGEKERYEEEFHARWSQRAGRPQCSCSSCRREKYESANASVPDDHKKGGFGHPLERADSDV